MALLLATQLLTIPLPTAMVAGLCEGYPLATVVGLVPACLFTGMFCSRLSLRLAHPYARAARVLLVLSSLGWLLFGATFLYNASHLPSLNLWQDWDYFSQRLMDAGALPTALGTLLGLVTPGYSRKFRGNRLP